MSKIKSYNKFINESMDDIVIYNKPYIDLINDLNDVAFISLKDDGVYVDVFYQYNINRMSDVAPIKFKIQKLKIYFPLEDEYQIDDHIENLEYIKEKIKYYGLTLEIGDPIEDIVFTTLYGKDIFYILVYNITKYIE